MQRSNKEWCRFSFRSSFSTQIIDSFHTDQFLWVAEWRTLIRQTDENACKAMTPTQERQPWNIDDVCLQVTKHQVQPASPLSPKTPEFKAHENRGGLRRGRSAAERDWPITHPCCEAVDWLISQQWQLHVELNPRCCRRCKIAQVQTHMTTTVLWDGGSFYWLWLQNSKIVELGGSTLYPS